LGVILLFLPDIVIIEIWLDKNLFLACLGEDWFVFLCSEASGETAGLVGRRGKREGQACLKRGFLRFGICIAELERAWYIIHHITEPVAFWSRTCKAFVRIRSREVEAKSSEERP
jgi:hypothetical protein